MQLTLVGMSSYIGTHTAGLIKMQPIGALFSKTVYVRDFDFQGATSLACPRILGPFCLALLGLEGIRSSSFTFDSHVSRN